MAGGSCHTGAIPAVPMLALLLAAPTLQANGQGADHSGGHGGDAIRCTSGKPEVAVIACTNIIQDRSEGGDKRTIALRNRAFHYQQMGDVNRAIADYTTALDHPEYGIQARTYSNRGLMYFVKGDEDHALAD